METEPFQFRCQFAEKYLKLCLNPWLNMVNLVWFTLLVKFESWCWRKSNSVPKTTFFEGKLSWIWLTVSKTRMSDFKKNDFDFRNISNNFFDLVHVNQNWARFYKILIIGCLSSSCELPNGTKYLSFTCEQFNLIQWNWPGEYLPDPDFIKLIHSEGNFGTLVPFAIWGQV